MCIEIFQAKEMLDYFSMMRHICAHTCRSVCIFLAHDATNHVGTLNQIQIGMNFYRLEMFFYSLSVRVELKKMIEKKVGKSAIYVLHCMVITH